MADSTQSASGVKDRIIIQEPDMYDVLLLNDDFTTMDFVVAVLEQIFLRPSDEALEIMLKVHHEGEGLAGTYPYDVAKTKAAMTSEAAKSAGFPLQLKIRKR